MSRPAGFRAALDQVPAHGFRALFPEAAIVFGRAAFVGEAGDDDGVGTILEKIRHLIERVLLPAADHHCCTFPCENFRSGLSDPTARASNDRDFVFQLAHKVTV